MPRRAFTLVELIVVIAIIGLLSTIAIVSVDSARVKSRNAKRTADLKQVMTAFGVAYSLSGSFPASGDACIASACTGAWSSVAADAGVDAFFSSYINPKPTDPVGGSRGRGGYIFTGNWTGGSSSGNYFPAGPIISFSLEGVTICPFGKIWWQGPAETECVVNLSL